MSDVYTRVPKPNDLISSTTTTITPGRVGGKLIGILGLTYNTTATITTTVTSTIVSTWTKVLKPTSTIEWTNVLKPTS